MKNKVVKHRDTISPATNPRKHVNARNMWFPIERIVSTTKPNKIWSNFGVFSAKSGSVARGAGRLSEVESSRTSLASRTSSGTHFEVLGLEVSRVRKLPCPRLEDSSIFEPLKFLWKTPETLRKICKDLFFGFLK